MFKLLDEPQWNWPVVARVPRDGGYDEQRFEARFRLIPSEEVAGLLDRDPSARAMLEAALIGWADVVDDEGEAVPFSITARNRMLGLPYAFAAIAGAYAESVAGAARKN